MKKIILLASLTLFALASCATKEDLSTINDRLDKIENSSLKSIDEQIASINVSIASLTEADKRIDGQILALQNTANNLQASLNATNTKIEEVRSELQGSIDKTKSDLLIQLEQLKSDTEAKIKLINEAIEELKEKDSQLTIDIENLKKYVDDQLSEQTKHMGELEEKENQLEKDIEDLSKYIDDQLNLQSQYTDNKIEQTSTWASATFATLEQYKIVTNDITDIKSTIEKIQSSIEEVELRVNQKIKNDIATAMSEVDEKIAAEVKSITSAYTDAISKAKDEITAAYTAAIKQAIQESEASLQKWVGEQLSAYSTIKDTEAKIDALKKDIEGQLLAQKSTLEKQIEDLKTTTGKETQAINQQIKIIQDSLIILDTKILANTQDIHQLQSDLVQMKKDVTADYTEAIKVAITKLQEEMAQQKKEITEGYTSAISEVNNSIRTDMAQMKKDITTEYTTAIANTKKDLEDKMNETVEAKVVAINKEIVDKINSRLDTLESDVAKLKTDVLTLFSSVSTLNAQVATLQNQVSGLLAQVQSITVIPDFNDGSVIIPYDSYSSINVHILPLSVGEQIAKIGKSIFKVNSVYTRTKSSTSFIQLNIESVAWKDNLLVMNVSGDKLSKDYGDENISANAMISISSGSTEISSSYFNIVPSSGIRTVTLTEEKRLSSLISFGQAKSTTELTIEGVVYDTDTDYLWSAFTSLRKLDMRNTDVRSGVFNLNTSPTLKLLVLPNLQTEWSTSHMMSNFFNIDNFTLLEKIIICNGCQCYVTGASYRYDANYLPSLTFIEISEGVTDITVQQSIATSTHRVNYIFPSTLSTISSECFFHGLPDMITIKDYVIIYAVTPPSNSGSGFHTSHYGTTYGDINKTLYVPAQSVEAYKTAPGWSQFQTILPIEEK